MTRNNPTMCFAVVLIAAFPTWAAGATLNVPGDFATIQGCIDAAQSGVDECVVAPGTYNECINFNGKAITLRSSDGLAVTTIDGAGLNCSVVKCIGGEAQNTVLDGFTITGGNTGGAGGGMLNTNSSPTVMNCWFVGNSAKVGGGMYNDNSSPTVTNCTFMQNTADFGGGGMRNHPGSSPIVTNCRFIDNTALTAGGMYNVANSSPVLTNCTFINNTATGASSSSGGGGGGIHNETNSNPTVLNCTFGGNQSTGTGPGGGMFSFDSNPTVANCVFWENSDSGGMDESAQIHHAGTGTSAVTYTCIQGLDTFAGNGNIGDDPMFVDANGPDNIPGTPDDDLRLLFGSPAIDAGSNDAVTTLEDLDGNQRIVNCIVDMGAYEFGSSPCSPGDLA